MYNCLGTGYVFILFVVYVAFVASQVPDYERQALVSFYGATNGTNWIDNGNWLEGDPCIDSWYGVFCNAEREHVLVIGLALNGLSGTMAPEISNLKELEAM